MKTGDILNQWREIYKKLLVAGYTLLVTGCRFLAEGLRHLERVHPHPTLPEAVKKLKFIRHPGENRGPVSF
jgi:hypothetical protein